MDTVPPNARIHTLSFPFLPQKPRQELKILITFAAALRILNKCVLLTLQAQTSPVPYTPANRPCIRNESLRTNGNHRLQEKHYPKEILYIYKINLIYQPNLST